MLLALAHLFGPLILSLFRTLKRTIAPSPFANPSDTGHDATLIVTNPVSPRVACQVDTVGRERLVLDLSCRKRDDGRYYVVTDRWQRFSELVVDEDTLDDLGDARWVARSGGVLRVCY